ncbi:MAG TPA: alpha/beta fold hydrolase [Nocardia sp.]|uniref:alpha/beta fold hydrolase n=1 Tax=Nocardia sp. TaxID=1821 RepID=UPI002B4AF065|nr:alpha/beta fold hydrolase [Nocardia sp.]HLS77556.1 alpha/beta fold hydrolase [Nocardia sp.]
MRRTCLDTPRGRVHARLAGDGDDLIPLLHQTAASSVMYERFVAAMLAAGCGARYRFLAPDTPGFGMSFTPETPYDPNDWADDMFAAVDALADGTGSPRRVHLLGHHTGAAIAGVMAATRPDRVASLAMIGAVAMDEPDRLGRRAGVRAMTVDPGRAPGAGVAPGRHRRCRPRSLSRLPAHVPTRTRSDPPTP